jgi:putative tricarboxylic transport membrane protein
MTPRIVWRGVIALIFRPIKMTLNRISGFFVAVAGAIALLWIIPNQTEIADSGWLRPATLPKITSIVIIMTGLVQFALPTGKAEFQLTLTLRVILFFVISLLSLYLMNLLGFLIAAPALVLIVMILIGERRRLWLVSGFCLMPLAIWVAVDILLNRPLP